MKKKQTSPARKYAADLYRQAHNFKLKNLKFLAEAFYARYKAAWTPKT